MIAGSLYFSSIGTFRPDRIRSIADKFGVDGNMALENILYGGFFTGLQFFALSWICVARAFNSEHQVSTVACTFGGYYSQARWNLLTNVLCGSPRIRTFVCWYVMSYRPSLFREYLVQIVDSIMALFRVDFSGRGELSERQQKVCIVSIVFCLVNVVFQLAQVP